MFKNSYVEKIVLFIGGVLFGTAGIKLLSSRDAKKLYTKATAAGLRVKDYALDTVAKVQENAEDILAEAKLINGERNEEDLAAEFEDEASEDNK
jgi:hypothetical protein